MPCNKCQYYLEKKQRDCNLRVSCKLGCKWVCWMHARKLSKTYPDRYHFEKQVKCADGINRPLKKVIKQAEERLAKAKLKTPPLKVKKVEKKQEFAIDRLRRHLIKRHMAPQSMVEKVPITSEEQLDMLTDFFIEGNDLKHYVEFRGRAMYEWGWLLWLQKQFKNETFCLPNHSILDKSFRFKNNELTISPKVLTSLKKCKERFFISWLSIRGSKSGHSNALIFDTKLKMMSRFEPHGGELGIKKTEKNRILDEKLEEWQKKELPSYTYFHPYNVCPYPGPQIREVKGKELLDDIVYNQTRKVFGKEYNKEARGFCAAWSLFFIHLQLKNPDKFPWEIAEKMLKWSEKELAEKIRKYAAFIVKTVNGHYEEFAKKLFKPGAELKIPSGIFEGVDVDNISFKYVVRYYKRKTLFLTGIKRDNYEDTFIFEIGNPSHIYAVLLNNSGSK